MRLLRGDKEVYGVAELAGVLGVSVPTVSAWHKRKTGPQSLIIGRRRYYRRDDINRWIISVSRGGDDLGAYREPYGEGYQAASNGAPKNSCKYLCALGELGLRTAWIAGWHQWHDEQGKAA